jgi:hypothetical protein
LTPELDVIMDRFFRELPDWFLWCPDFRVLGKGITTVELKLVLIFDRLGLTALSCFFEPTVRSVVLEKSFLSSPMLIFGFRGLLPFGKLSRSVKFPCWEQCYLLLLSRIAPLLN